MKILVAGDSFAADWTVEHKGHVGWPNLLAEAHSVTNLAQAGCSEYRIYKQLAAAELSKFDVIIVSHTSPYRLYVPEHPLHSENRLHKNSDVIYTDIQGRVPVLEQYFEQYFDLEYARFVHSAIGKEIRDLLQGFPSLHLQHVEGNMPCEFDNTLDLSREWKKYRGLINHYSDKGNTVIYNIVSNSLAGL